MTATLAGQIVMKGFMRLRPAPCPGRRPRSPPFILCHSAVGLLGVLLGGQRFAVDTAHFSAGALAGAVLGSVIGLRWMSERTTRYFLAAVLIFAGFRLLFR